MDLDSQKRPTAKDICLELTQWQNVLRDFSISGYDENKVLYIKENFLIADKIAKELQIPPPKHLDSIYTSTIINTKHIINAI
ncbi:48_t:CDS:1, partial [Dentiscutata heterogama]